MDFYTNPPRPLEEPDGVPTVPTITPRPKETTRDHVVDKIIEKFLFVSLPLPASTTKGDDPELSLASMATNLRKLNAR